MPLCKNSFLLKISLCLFTFFVGFYGQSQIRQPYSGPFQLESYTGNANYTYKLVDGDTILDGTFQMKRSNLEALLQKSDSSFSISGNFSNDYPNGDWRFQFGEFKSDSTTQVVDFQYKLNVDGVQNEALGNIAMGKPDGQWQFNINQIKNSEIAQVLFKSTIQFDNGVPQKSFQIQNENSTLVGRFLRDGLAHDQWTLYVEDDLDAVETWLFSNGLLKSIEYTENGQKNEITVYSTQPKNTKSITMDSRYFQILKVKASKEKNASVLEQKMNALLKENAKQYEKINVLLEELSESSSFYPDFKVQVGHYPLDSIEQVQLASIKDFQGQSKTIVDDFLGNTQLNILSLSDERANYLYEVVKAIFANYVEPLNKLVSYDKEEMVELVTRSELISNLWPNGLPGKELVLDISNAPTYIGPNAEQYDFGKISMSSLEQIAAYSGNALEVITKELNAKLAIDKRQQEYQNIEEQLIQKRNELTSVVDSTQASISGEYSTALKNIQSFADTRLASYSNMQEGSPKLELGRKLVGCFDKLNALANSVAMQPQRSTEIEEKYLDAIWNPFMANIMNEEVKKRITASYRKVLLPYYLEQTSTALSCDNANSLIQAFDQTHERMLQLRDEETKKLERKLKREQDPLVVMQLFNLQPLGEN